MRRVTTNLWECLVFGRAYNDTFTNAKVLMETLGEVERYHYQEFTITAINEENKKGWQLEFFSVDNDKDPRIYVFIPADRQIPPTIEELYEEEE